MAQKNSKPNKKRLKIVLISLAVVLLLSITAVLVFIFLPDQDKKDKEKDSKEKIENWDNRIADLENEPTSDMDVIYSDTKKTSENPYMIQVNKSQNIIIIYKKNQNGKYTTPYKAMICSVGFDTPIGEFTTSDKYQWKIVNGNVWAQYATRVVGNVLFHSMPYAANSKDTLLTKYYNQLGSTLSASCIRLSAKDAQWIMENCPAGTKVQIYESENEEPMARPKSIIVPEDAAWDPTDQDPANPYQSIQLAFEGIDGDKMVQRGTQVNYMAGITIKDTCGNDISSEVVVMTNLDSFTLGTYEVKYNVEDAAGKEAEATVRYQVIDTAPPQFSGLKETIAFASIADVTQENILKGVYVIDNNEILDNNRISVVIPTIVEGDNAVTLSVTDDYNNTTTVTVKVSVHVKPPVITLKPGMQTIIPLTQNVDQAYALSRVTAMNDGVVMPADRITVSITPMAWGYEFRYTATNESGYAGVLNDSVTYVEYTIIPPKDLTVTNINDREQLMRGVALNNNLGESLDPSAIKVSTENIAENQYRVTYSYTYTSPLGSKTATATATVILEGVTPTVTPKPTVIPTPSIKPTETAKPANTDKPEESEPPKPSSSAPATEPPQD